MAQIKQKIAEIAARIQMMENMENPTDQKLTRFGGFEDDDDES